MNAHVDKSKILEYWRTVEFFLPQKVPDLKPQDLSHPVYQIKESHQPPWDKDHKFNKAAINNNHQTRHIVYGGVYSIDKIRETMENILGKDPNTFDERKGGDTCMFSIQLTEDGRPLFDSFILSTCAWALGRLKSPGPQKENWLSGFDAAQDNLKKEFEQKYALQNEDEDGTKLKIQGFNIGRQIAVAEILESIRVIEKTLSITHLKAQTDYIIVRSFIISRGKKNYEVDDSDFLNSFFIKDLAKVSQAVTKDKISTPLIEYLQESINTAKRIDVRKYPPLDKFSNIMPNEFPHGCWPTKGFYPLAYAQQWAVNTIFKKLRNQAGLFSVNGPPGTGKTTLLRDLVAGVIVERAIQLATLTTPQEAFSGSSQWTTDNKTQNVFLWKENLQGFEMVVASSNNSAVENITIEIPMEEAIDPSYFSSVNYFSDIATEILNDKGNKVSHCWALLAAKLGNKTNRSNFIRKFWAQSYKNKKTELEKDQPDPPSFYKFLTQSNEVTPWPEAVQTFKAALASEKELRQYRQALFEKQKLFLVSEEQLASLHDKILLTQSNKCLEEKKIQELQTEYQTHQQQRQTIYDRRLQHHQFKPNILDIIFSLGKAYKPWQEKDFAYQQQISTLEKALDQLSTTIKQHELKLTGLQKELLTLTDAVTDWQKKQEEVKKGKILLAGHFPDMTLLQNEEALELSAPWMDNAWFQARANVFLAALNLHRAFIENNTKIFLTNLTAAIDLLQGKAQNAGCTPAVRSAWATFFFVVPVVSTTFASFDRLFPQLEEASLGWLFIDEAGQATPQAAVGALWRSKRAIVVGDPLQLEPILAIPITAQEALRKHADVSETWLPKRISAQILSDRVNPYGTYLPTQNKELVWIGAPLRVHRRCDNPMFHIANRIAYDGMMVFGTPSRQSLSLEDSCWIHIKSESSDGHWIAAEGQAVQQLLDDLTQTIDHSDIVMISPFTTVVKELRGLRTSIKAGTIHTMQGKESDIIILVLGGNPSKPGAKEWAAEKPNMLNVAVSRAKRRLYVVGNKEAWATLPYFRELAQLL